METIINFLNIFKTVAPDFQVMFNGAKDLIFKNNIYLNLHNFTGNTNLPQTMLFYIPYTYFPYLYSQNIFTLFSIASLLASITILLKTFEVKKVYIYTIVIFMFSMFSFPVKFSLGMGQSGLITLLFVSLFVYFWKSNKILASIVLGLLVSYKIIFAYLLLVLLIKRKFKETIISLSTFAFLVVVSVIIYGSFDLYVYYVKDVLPNLLTFSGKAIVYNQGVSGLVARSLGENVISSYISIAITIFFVVLNIYKVKKSQDFLKNISITILTMLLIDTYSWQHHFVLLLIPLIYTISKIKNFKDTLFLISMYILVYFDANLIMFKSNLFLATILILFKII